MTLQKYLLKLIKMPRQARLAQIKQDLAQFNRLFQLAQRSKVKDILSKQITFLNSEQLKIQKQIENEKHKIQQQKHIQQLKAQQPVHVEAPKTSSNIIYTALTKYSWEDEKGKIKIYFTLDNIKDQCTSDLVDAQFKANSVQVKIRNYRKQNLIFSIKKTFGQIVPAQCKYLIKSNMIVVTLSKKSSGTWTQLNFKQDKFGTTKKEKEDLSDPNASIMNMMKKMYEDGDQNMKRTMAEAWSKSKDNKQGPDSFKFD